MSCFCKNSPRRTLIFLFFFLDSMGLHRVENPSHADNAISLHLYSPPFNTCQIFNQQTGQATKATCTFWSKFGERRNRVIITKKIYTMYKHVHSVRFRQFKQVVHLKTTEHPQSVFTGRTKGSQNLRAYHQNNICKYVSTHLKIIMYLAYIND